MSDLSKIYSQYQESLLDSQSEFNKRLRGYSKAIDSSYDSLLKGFIREFGAGFSSQVNRLDLKGTAERFFGTSEIPFAAIDGSCDKRQSVNFVSFYGGAYGAKGVISLSGPEGKLRYQRWDLTKDVSMVAFVPIPPDAMGGSTDGSEPETETPPVLSDSEIAETSSLHTRVMQLAEVYLAYSLARSSAVDAPRLLMLDNSLSGILGNSSFSPKNTRLPNATFGGESLTLADMHVALAHPFNRALGVPSTKKFQPHHRLIAEAVWHGKSKVSSGDCPNFPPASFKAGASYLASPEIDAGAWDSANSTFTFKLDPRASWSKSVRVYEQVCEALFREKSPTGLLHGVAGDDSRLEYFTVRDLSFLIGVGIRSLIEISWERKILLIGVVKDSASRFFYRNFLGSVLVARGSDPARHLSVPLSDRSIIELLPNTSHELHAPWGTVEFDACFMTLHPERPTAKQPWEVKGYNHQSLGETTRPERIFLRSLIQFLLADNGVASHALFLDRLAYPDWDDKDSGKLCLNTHQFGAIDPLFFETTTPNRLQHLSLYLLTILVRNHFPDALGYPDPLHQADWGAKSMKRRVTGLLDSSEIAFRANPLYKTFRSIRESFGR